MCVCVLPSPLGRLNTSSQCYKHSTSLYLQVCKNRAIFKIICGHKWCPIQNYHAALVKKFVLKSGNRNQHIEFDSTMRYN